MNETEIKRIGAEAAQDEAQENAQDSAAEQVQQLAEIIEQDTAEQFADFLDMAAKIAGHGFNVPTIPARFTHTANLDIAKAAIKLCDKYGLDAKAILIGQDSTVGAWLGLVVAVGLPGYAVYNDIKIIKAKEAKEAAAANDENAENNGKQSSQ